MSAARDILRPTRRLAVQRVGLAALTIAGLKSRAEASQVAHSGVQQVDHILVSAADAPSLFRFFAETLELPLAWRFATFGGFSSGGVFAGNVNIEILSARGPLAGGAAARAVGLALQPRSLGASVAELRARQIPVGESVPFRSSPWPLFAKTLWTTASLPSVSWDSFEVFLCEYSDNVSEKRRALKAQLDANAGGPIGLDSVRELACRAPDAGRMGANWAQLLGAAAVSTDGVVAFGTGPALRLDASRSSDAHELALRVHDLARARRYLGARGLQFTDSGGALALRSPSLRGLGLTLSEKP